MQPALLSFCIILRPTCAMIIITPTSNDLGLHILLSLLISIRIFYARYCLLAQITPFLFHVPQQMSSTDHTSDCLLVACGISDLCFNILRRSVLAAPVFTSGWHAQYLRRLDAPCEHCRNINDAQPDLSDPSGKRALMSPSKA